MFNFDLISLIETIGYFGLFVIVLVESGIIIGFFLPGDSLLFTAGFLASQKILNIWWLILILPVAAILGDSVGYWFGRRVGPKIFSRSDSRFFRRAHLEKTREFFRKHGRRAIVLARFAPIVRTFTPVLAGVGEMSYRHFLAFNIIGGIIWSTAMTGAGYFLGQAVPNAERYFWPIIGGIIFISFIPTWWPYLKARLRRAPAGNDQRGFFGLLGLLITFGVIVFMLWLGLDLFSPPTSAVNEPKANFPDALEGAKQIKNLLETRDATLDPPE